jgi:nucleotide-binding universal stress UspA family protein
MVPLDGSALAEKALPLAHELAAEWAASIWLVHVISHYPVSGFPRTEIDREALTDEVARLSSQRYLDQAASGLGGDVYTHVLNGSPRDELATASSSASPVAPNGVSVSISPPRPTPESVLGPPSPPTPVSTSARFS